MRLNHFISVLYFGFVILTSKAFSNPNDDFEATFFDVGQGSCVLLTFGGRYPPLLYDGGSMKESVNTPQSKTIPLIKAKISESIPPSKRSTQLNVIVSHADRDHMNWLPKIFDDYKRSSCNINFLLGGKKEDYESNASTAPYKKQFNDTIEKLVKQEKIYVADYQDGVEPTAITYGAGGPSIKILSANKNEIDINASSIVLLVTYKNNSIILTGDAPSKIKGDILDKHLDLTKIDLLQVSHHGADQDDEDIEERWLMKLQPNNCIISAGDYKRYDHPRNRTIKRLIKFAETYESYHLLSYALGQNKLTNKKRKRSSDNKQKDQPEPIIYKKEIESEYFDLHDHCCQRVTIENFSRIQSGFYIAITNAKIFSTHNQGTITYRPDLGIQFSIHLPPIENAHTIFESLFFHTLQERRDIVALRLLKDIIVSENMKKLIFSMINDKRKLDSNKPYKSLLQQINTSRANFTSYPETNFFNYDDHLMDALWHIALSQNISGDADALKTILEGKGFKTDHNGGRLVIPGNLSKIRKKEPGGVVTMKKT